MPHPAVPPWTAVGVDHHRQIGFLLTKLPRAIPRTDPVQKIWNDKDVVLAASARAQARTKSLFDSESRPKHSPTQLQATHPQKATKPKFEIEGHTSVGVTFRGTRGSERSQRYTVAIAVSDVLPANANALPCARIYGFGTCSKCHIVPRSLALYVVEKLGNSGALGDRCTKRPSSASCLRIFEVRSWWFAQLPIAYGVCHPFTPPTLWMESPPSCPANRFLFEFLLVVQTKRPAWHHFSHLRLGARTRRSWC